MTTPTETPAVTPAVTAAEEVAVATGAHLLDTTTPDWWRTVDPYAITLDSATTCPLGQLFGDFDTGLTHLMTLDGNFDEHAINDTEIRTLFAVDHGFDSDNHASPDRAFALLAAFWVDEINRRRWAASTTELRVVDDASDDPWAEVLR